MPIEIKEKAEDVIPYIPNVREGADTAKEELGFLPKGAYESFATSGKLFVATATTPNSEIYAGHLIFGGLFPQAKVFQLFVAPAFRGHGIARQLITLLKDRLTAGHWLSIVANVADDLPANSFWARVGFKIVRTKAGGTARKRRINVRVLDLETPSLLTIMGAFPRKCDLRFAERYSQRPIYLFDLNVFFDVVRKRHRSEAAAKVVWAGMANSIRLMVAAEFRNELLRTSQNPENDPVLAFASRADSLSQPPEKELRQLILKLAPAIFPERNRNGILTKQDVSDITHIATAIHHGAAGFITSEKAILRARLHLLENWQLDVIGVEEFSELLESRQKEVESTVAEMSTGVLRTRMNKQSDLAQVRSFLQEVRVLPSFSDVALDCRGTESQWVVVIDRTDKLVGFAKWNVHGGTKRTADIYVVVNEFHPSSEAIIDHLLDVIPRQICTSGTTLTRLNIPAGQIETRQTALAMGFRPPYGAVDDHLILQRLAVGRIISSTNWHTVRQSLISVASLSLPAHIPTFNGSDMQMALTTGGREIVMPLPEIERVLSPVLFLFSGRDGVIIPIREHFARDLIGASPQLSMLAPPEAILRHERVYISGPRTIRQLNPGTPILFYESQNGKGRGCIFAIARITDSRVVNKSDALRKVMQRGVLDQRTLEKRSAGRKVTETSFDNIFVFRTPVPLKRLRELGCADGSNFISAKTISFEKLAEIVKEGQING